MTRALSLELCSQRPATERQRDFFAAQHCIYLSLGSCGAVGLQVGTLYANEWLKVGWTSAIV